MLKIAGWHIGVWALKGILGDSNNIFLWHESEDVNKKDFQNFSWFQFYIYKLCMIMGIAIAP